MTTSDNPDIFREEWLACLSAHYLHTLRAGDTKNAQGLRGVLREAGMVESDIDALAIGAGFDPATHSAVNENPSPAVEKAEPEAMQAGELAELTEPTEAPAISEADTSVEVEPQSRPPTLAKVEIVILPISEQAITLDLFSLPPAPDTAPADPLPAVEPELPTEPTMLPLPLTDIPEDDLGSPAKRVRSKPKPKPKAPPQRPLF